MLQHRLETMTTARMRPRQMLARWGLQEYR